MSCPSVKSYLLQLNLSGESEISRISQTEEWPILVCSCLDSLEISGSSVAYTVWCYTATRQHSRSVIFTKVCKPKETIPCYHVNKTEGTAHEARQITCGTLRGSMPLPSPPKQGMWDARARHTSSTLAHTRVEQVGSGGYFDLDTR